MEVYVDDEAKLTLHGLQQHYNKLKDSEKNRKLFEVSQTYFLLETFKYDDKNCKLSETKC